jgi:hypothetical protein
MSFQEDYEKQLDSFDATERQEALDALIEGANDGTITLPPIGDQFNLHCHSFYSFNGYGYSPSSLAWRGRAAGLCAMGLIDFDVLDGVDEFLNACNMLGLRYGAGLETRVFVSEFAGDEINSPGEPGISYHIGAGFTSSTVAGKEGVLLRGLKAMAQQRTGMILERVNTLLEEIALNFEEDVLPLTPAGNATERHLCAAYHEKACTQFQNAEDIAQYWSKKLNMSVEQIAKALNDPPVFQGILRGKTMKAGGIGYVQAQGDEFPSLEAVNELILSNGAIPTFAFLDGTSSGEAKMDDLLDCMTASGVAAITIIPERNWNIADAAVKERKLSNLAAFVQRTRARALPIFIGTEMNAYGQRFVDKLDTPELRPYFSDFQEGMYILHAHTTLQATAGMGYLSEWAADNFASVRDKNRFFARFGKAFTPGTGERLEQITPDITPQIILKAL